ncbi:copper resistance protein B [Sphingomonas sp. LY160]|uniref:copper resistance protein B n=1 Tax=Sphingomonas sp. LY160 TaxID=3095342 RepID=UPI002ADEB90A|nr:copper resistance protein B [Sphingomonas sp. LY160]MEA1070973.1 copper resistance protein B [Sphingomonas sp. LY160]
MTRVSIALFGAAASLALMPSDALAQHQGHNMPGMSMPAPAKKAPARKRPVVKKAPAPKASTKKAAPKKAAPKKAAPKAEPVTDPHAGHDMSAMPAPTTEEIILLDESSPSGTDLPAGNAPPPPVPTDRAADAVFGKAAMEMGRHHLDHFHGGQTFSHLMIDKAEAKFGNGHVGFEWDLEGWTGGDINRAVVKSEGEGAFGKSLEKVEVQVLYSRAIATYFNLQAGLRHDILPNPSRTFAVAGLEGLAPAWFEVEGSLFLSNKGELMTRAEASTDQRITQRLILQPRAEINLAAQSSRETGVGAGLSDAEVGVRLRYDIRREFSPYVGAQVRRSFGATRRYLRDEGEKPTEWSLLTGVRFWF